MEVINIQTHDVSFSLVSGIFSRVLILHKATIMFLHIVKLLRFSTSQKDIVI